MDNLESKKLALLRILQILEQYSDYDHPLTQGDISKYLESDYGIAVERKTISRNLSLLKEAGFEIEQTRAGSYLESRDFEDSELRVLIDGVLCSKYISATHTKDLIDRICNLSNSYFRSNIKHISAVKDFNKTPNKALFFNIELIDTAIEDSLQLEYDYNKCGVDKKLHKTSHQCVSPYQTILHNQRYYLIGASEYWGDLVCHRIDHITNMSLTDRPLTPIKKIEGYENGIDYKDHITSLPYMYPDKREWIEFLADTEIIDQIIDWFGYETRLFETEDKKKVRVRVNSSPMAMEHWAMQYVNFVEVLSPKSLRKSIKNSLKNGVKKYKDSLK